MEESCKQRRRSGRRSKKAAPTSGQRSRSRSPRRSVVITADRDCNKDKGAEKSSSTSRSRDEPYSSQFPTTPTVWALATEYSRYFNNYVSSSAPLHATVSTFLQGIMTPAIMVGSQFGVEAQLENWRFFALFFNDVQLELKDMNMPTTHTLVAGTITSVTITSNTLRRAFPHLNNDGCGGTKGGAWSPLADRLLGQKLVMRGSVLFGWDCATNKVVRLNFQADMMTPMTKLLGNLPDVACVFNKARVTPDCRLKEKTLSK